MRGRLTGPHCFVTTRSFEALFCFLGAGVPMHKPGMAGLLIYGLLQNLKIFKNKLIFRVISAK
jgi:hypothetical protein